MKNEFDYKGYVITENFVGNYEVNGYEFPTIEEAMDWIDDLDTTEESEGPYMYYVSYLVANGNRHYDEYLWAYDKQDAINQVKSDNPDLYRLLQCYRAE